MSLAQDSTTTLNELQGVCSKIDNLPSDAAGRAAMLREQITSLQGILQSNQAALTYLEQDHSSADKLAEIHKKSKENEATMAQLQQKKKEYQEQIRQMQAAIDAATNSIDKQRQQITLGLEQTANFERLLKQRMQVVATRDRMLQLSQERNIYKKKIIYILLSIVIVLIVAIIATYNFFSKK